MNTNSKDFVWCVFSIIHVLMIYAWKSFYHVHHVRLAFPFETSIHLLPIKTFKDKVIRIRFIYIITQITLNRPLQKKKKKKVFQSLVLTLKGRTQGERGWIPSRNPIPYSFPPSQKTHLSIFFSTN